MVNQFPIHDWTETPVDLEAMSWSQLLERRQRLVHHLAVNTAHISDRRREFLESLIAEVDDELCERQAVRRRKNRLSPL